MKGHSKEKPSRGDGFLLKRSETFPGQEKSIIGNLFVLFAFLAGILSLVFTNLNYDCEYQIAMGYRFVRGDLPVLQMWEPHQGSALLIALLEKVFLFLRDGDTTGIVLYLNICGLIIKCGIGLFLYKVMRRYSDRNIATAGFLVFLLIPVKESLLPDFGNVTLWYGLLSQLFLLEAYDPISSGRKKGSDPFKLLYLLLSAVFLCFQIIAYPSCILLYFVVLYCMRKIHDAPVRDFFLYTGICLAIGIILLSWVYFIVGLPALSQIIQAVFLLEPTHTEGLGSKWEIIGGNAFVLALFCILLRGVKTWLERDERKREYAPVICIGAILLYILGNTLRAQYRVGYYDALFLIWFVGFLFRKRLKASQKAFYLQCNLWSGGIVLAVLLLSDQSLGPAFPFGLVALVASLLPLGEAFSGNHFGRPVMMGLLFVLSFRCVYLHVPIYGNSQIYTIAQDLSIVRSGPAMGIIADEESVIRQRDSMEEWEELIQDGQGIYLMGPVVDTIGYLYRDTEVCAPSVMSTPTYNSSVALYYEMNPEKMPDVLILSSTYGTLREELTDNAWLQQWIEESFRPQKVVDGHYWRYYFR